MRVAHHHHVNIGHGIRSERIETPETVVCVNTLKSLAAERGEGKGGGEEEDF